MTQATQPALVTQVQLSPLHNIDRKTDPDDIFKLSGDLIKRVDDQQQKIDNLEKEVKETKQTLKTYRWKLVAAFIAGSAIATAVAFAIARKKNSK